MTVSRCCSASNTATLSQVRENTPGVDWLTVYQDHPYTLPFHGDDLVLYTDPESGELRKQWVTGHQHEGSHDSSLRVRCDGHRVEVSGNPARWCQPHNLRPVASVREGIEIFNDLLVSVGLPPFTMPERHAPLRGSFRSTGAEPEGCVLRRVDLCRGYVAGNPADAARFVRYLSSVTHQGKPGRHPTGAANTVCWGGGRYTYVKYYLKGLEMLRHAETDEDRERAERVIAAGLIRLELTLKSQYLKRYGLHDPTAWNDEIADATLEKYTMHHRLGTTTNGYDSIADDLIARGVPPARAARAQHAAKAWLAGDDLRAQLSKSAFYRLKGDLALAGLDIGQPCNVATIRHTVREVCVAPISVAELERLAA